LTASQRITRFAPLLNQIGDLRDTVITADALHCQRDHVGYLAERGADWSLTVKGDQPTNWLPCPGGLPRTPLATPVAVHGRREIRSRNSDRPDRDRLPARRSGHPDPPPTTPPGPAGGGRLGLPGTRMNGLSVDALTSA
jgi:hypothetical protein